MQLRKLVQNLKKTKLMEIRSQFYCTHLSDVCEVVPKEALQEILDELCDIARFNMSCELHPALLAQISQATVSLLKENARFRHFPIHIVAEAFNKGSLGELGGTTKLTIRNINIWLVAMNERMIQVIAEKKSREDSIRRTQELALFKSQQKNSNLYGQALFRKIEWAYAGILSSREYDRCTLDKIVEKMNQGYRASEITPSMIL